MKGISYLYPVPVIKNEKYLVELPHEHSDFFILAFKEKFIESLDKGPSFAKFHGVHTDGKTKIFKIDFGELHFHLLTNSQDDPQKALTIEKLLSSKIIDCLKGEPGSKKTLLKSFEKQKKCSTCQKLGILNPAINALISCFY